MPLLALPNELILIISDNLQHKVDLNALCRSCRQLNNLLNEKLYLPEVCESDRVPAQVIQFGIQNTVTLFAKAGVNMNRIEAAERKSPLSEAIRGLDVDMVKLLLQHGADPNYRGRDRVDYLSLVGEAIVCGGDSPDAIAIIEALIDGGETLCPPYPSEHPMALALTMGPYKKIVKLLLEHNVDLENCWLSGLRASDHMRASDDWEIIEMLVKAEDEQGLRR